MPKEFRRIIAVPTDLETGIEYLSIRLGNINRSLIEGSFSVHIVNTNGEVLASKAFFQSRSFDVAKSQGEPEIIYLDLKIKTSDIVEGEIELKMERVDKGVIEEGILENVVVEIGGIE